MGLFGKKKEEKSCCCGSSCTPEAMAQAVRDSEKFQDGSPAVFHRRNRGLWLVTQRLEDWLELYNRWGLKDI